MAENEEKKRIVKIKPDAIDFDVLLPVAKDHTKELKEVIDALEKSQEAVLQAISKDEQSLFSNRKILSYLKVLMKFSHEMAIIGFITYFSSDYLHRKVDALEQIVGIMQKQLKDLPAPEDVKKLGEAAKQMVELEAALKKLKELEDQAVLEKANVFRTIDKARQQVMKDIV